jgi:hypothetical protein
MTVEATAAERRRALSGDGFVCNAAGAVMHAVTICNAAGLRVALDRADGRRPRGLVQLRLDRQ